jgi:hypothetical protein
MCQSAIFVILPEFFFEEFLGVQTITPPVVPSKQRRGDNTYAMGGTTKVLA